MPAVSLEEISIQGADACEQTIKDVFALDTAFILDSHDGGTRFWDEIQRQYQRATSALQGETNGQLNGSG